MCQQGGIFVLQLFDNYAATYSLLFIGLVECMVLSWVYGKTEHPHTDCLVCSEPKIFYTKIVHSSPTCKGSEELRPFIAGLVAKACVCGRCLVTLSLTINEMSCDFVHHSYETLKWLS